MADSGDAEHKYDVFLVHSSEDKGKAQQLDQVLRDNGLSTYVHFKSEDGDDRDGFFVGKFIVDNINYAVKNSRTVLILVTENALTSGWVTFEIILSIEKSFSERAMCVILLFEGLDPEAINKFKTGDLQFIPDFVLDFNDESWKTKLVERIKAPHPKVGDILPHGNVAHGLVFNYFAGYLRNILPNLITSMNRCKFPQDKMLQKMVLLIPTSCKAVQIDGNYGDVIVDKETEVLEIIADHGDKTRPFKIPIYRISKGDETFYFPADCPLILETMKKMTSFCEVAPSFLKLQVEKFRKTLMQLVNHRGNLSCIDTVNFIEWDDTAVDSRTSVGDELWSAVTEGRKADTESSKTVHHVGKLENQATDKKFFATITNVEEESEEESEENSDKKAAINISKFLTNKNVSFTNGDGQPKIQVLGEAQWNIFVISKKACKNGEFLTQLNSAFQESVNNNVIQVIPIVAKGTSIDDLPNHIRNMTLLEEKEDSSHLTQMWATMEGPPKTMKDVLPFIPVHQGLAYAYTVNYLAISLDGQTKDGKGFRDRFVDAVVKYKLVCPCVPRVFLITGESCDFVVPGTQFNNERYVGKLEPVVMGVREYFLHLFELTMKNGKKVCYAREYTTPSVSLHEMAHKYPFAGMNVEQMKQEAADFVELCRKITQDDKFKAHIGDIKDKCEFVYYKDTESMTEALERALQKYLNAGDMITPSELT